MRIVPILLALVLTVPFVTAGPGLTDALQDDPGTGGGDASDSMDAPTFLEGYDQAGWVSGTVVPVDDEVDVYAVELRADGTSHETDLRVIVDPDTPLDIALLVSGPQGQFAFIDAQGMGRAEVFDLASLREPGMLPYGVWTFAVLARSSTGGAVGPVALTGPSGTTPLELDYQMDLACQPYC